MSGEVFSRLRLRQSDFLMLLPGAGPIVVPGYECWECCVWDSLDQPAVVLASFDTSREADEFCDAWNSA